MPAGELHPSQLAFGGRWAIAEDAATAARRASLALRFDARRVFLVLGSAGAPADRCGSCSTAGRSPTPLAGPDVHHGVATISNQRLYRLVDLPRPGDHLLTLRPAAGIAGYAFTFG